MNTKTKTTLALACALLLASTVQAGPQAAPKPMNHGKMEHATMKMPATPEARAKMANAMFDKIDTDQDGSLSRAEFVAHHRIMSMEHGGMPMDRHGKDGKKHAGTGHHAAEHSGHAPPAAGSSFAKLDGNKDGKLSKAEMAKHPMAAHFAMLDTDKNGYLSPKEAAAHGL